VIAIIESVLFSIRIDSGSSPSEVVLVVNDGSQADCAIAEAKKTVVANLRPKAVAEVTEQLVVGQAASLTAVSPAIPRATS
jgi:hypothetical protein